MFKGGFRVLKGMFEGMDCRNNLYLKALILLFRAILLNRLNLVNLVWLCNGLFWLI